MVDNEPNGSPARVASEHVLRNVQAIMEVGVRAEIDVSRHQRAIEWATALLGRPMTLYAVLMLVLVWIGTNVAAPWFGRVALDPPPFSGLQGVVGLSGLLVATLVLITQSRQARLTERRMHLDLQINLLTEQKAAKLIELVEELRRDLPNVGNRRDAEAEQMQHAAAPVDVVAALDAEASGALNSS